MDVPLLSAYHKQVILRLHAYHMPELPTSSLIIKFMQDLHSTDWPVDNCLLLSVLG